MSNMDKHAECDGERGEAVRIATAWFVRMRSPERTPEEEHEFHGWLAEDERHSAAFASVERAWVRTMDLEAHPVIRSMRQQALRVRRNTRVHFRAAAASFVRSLRLRRSGWGMAAGVASVLVLTVMSLNIFMAGSPGTHAYATAAGETATVTLADSSRVTLASDSRLTATFSDKARHIVLSRGEAYFDVTHDPARPFRVEAGDGTTTALGTEFNVRKEGGDVAVTLVEGSVEVAALAPPQADSATVRRLRPGEQVSYDESGLSDVREVDIARVISWRKDRMVVTDEPLLNVIDEMNRHSDRKLKVDRSDPRLRRLLVTGQFRTGQPELIVEYLRAAGFRVWVTRDSEGNITLRLGGEPSRG